MAFFDFLHSRKRYASAYVQAGELAFRELDVEACRRKFDLESKGTKHGKEDQPPSDSTNLDDVEHEIITFVDSEFKSGSNFAVNSLKVSKNSIADVQSSSTFEQLKNRIRDAELRLEIAQREIKNDIHSSKKDVKAVEGEERRFREKNCLEREPHISESPRLDWGLLLFILVTEVVLNASFYASGHAAGIFGGASVATILAILNCAVAGAVGRLVIPKLNHILSSERLLGRLLFVLGIGFALFWNLFVGHYRETFTDPSLNLMDSYEKGKLAVQGMLERPFVVHDFDSWVLIIFGIGCFALVVYKSYRMGDPYPGYGNVRSKLDSAKMRYTQGVKLAHLRILQIGARAQMDIETVLARFMSDSQSLRVRVMSQEEIQMKLENYRSSLEQVANTLLSSYRSANERSRNTPVPERFNQRWTLEAPVVDFQSLSENAEKVQTKLKEEQKQLSKLGENISEALKQAVRELDKLDDLDQTPLVEEQKLLVNE